MTTALTKKKAAGLAISKYNSAMCEQMIALGKVGASQKMMFAELGISYNTAQRYKKDHEDFAEALDRAVVHAQAFWETKILENIENKNFNSRLVEIALRGQFKEDYRETKEPIIAIKNEVVIDFSGVVNDLIKNLNAAK